MFAASTRLTQSLLRRGLRNTTAASSLLLSNSQMVKAFQPIRCFSIDTGNAADNEGAAKAAAKEFLGKAKEESHIDEITQYD
jgi:hypothetical protein